MIDIRLSTIDRSIGLVGATAILESALLSIVGVDVNIGFHTRFVIAQTLAFST
jgi:hypothetical protein